MEAKQTNKQTNTQKRIGETLGSILVNPLMSTRKDMKSKPVLMNTSFLDEGNYGVLFQKVS